MRRGNQQRKVVVAFAALLLCVVGTGRASLTLGQQLTTPTKFDEFTGLRTEDEMAHLDLFAEQLRKDSNLTGIIVGYLREAAYVGSQLREIHGYYSYLVNKRGIPSERLRVVFGGVKDKSRAELWLVLAGTATPIEAASLAFDLTSPVLFDDVFRGPDCRWENSIKLEEPEDALRFFAEALKANPSAKGQVVIYPSQREAPHQTQELTASLNQVLVKSDLLPGRVTFNLDSSRSCVQVRFWMVADSFQVEEGNNVAATIQDQLMVEAEKHQYTFRRVEFVGNTYTRDNILRRRILGLQEGDIFTIEGLKSNLKSLSSLKTIKPVGLEHVDIHMNKQERTIDLSIFVTDLSRGPR